MQEPTGLGAGPIVTWVVVGLVLLALVGIAIGTAARRSSRAVRWHDEANSIAEQGAEVVDAVRIWAGHAGSAGAEVWADLRGRTVAVARAARELGEGTKATRPRELAEQAAAAADGLDSRIAAFDEAGEATKEAARPALFGAADEFDRALAALRTAI